MYINSNFKMYISRLCTMRLTLSPPIKLMTAIFLVCFNFESHSKLVKMLSDNLTNQPLIQIQAVCMWGFGSAWQAKG